jgi:hypothetical protein
MIERIGWQLERRKGIPSTTTALEQYLLKLEDFINKRTFAFRNRERTNRMLQLMQLHLNTLIRRQLGKAGGHPATRRITPTRSATTRPGSSWRTRSTGPWTDRADVSARMCRGVLTEHRSVSPWERHSEARPTAGVDNHPHVTGHPPIRSAGRWQPRKNSVGALASSKNHALGAPCLIRERVDRPKHRVDRSD